ncbi:hypothetical protein BESB_049690 [Besnoitia besnoiti]|uniref:Sec7 domain-containing protein n=1 Tax=Besnoitia besnoiti TaxID=94643 RepID=A0A2A9MM28_BESBE|nr:hypothetical protein BESB_049690 [Besnoitia besnoiti]PFH36777.1 hypothetical protein BESB_049690 [Besnoitia besnoiti]
MHTDTSGHRGSLEGRRGAGVHALEQSPQSRRSVRQLTFRRPRLRDAAPREEAAGGGRAVGRERGGGEAGDSDSARASRTDEGVSSSSQADASRPRSLYAKLYERHIQKRLRKRRDVVRHAAAGGEGVQRLEARDARDSNPGGLPPRPGGHDADRAAPRRNATADIAARRRGERGRRTSGDRRTPGRRGGPHSARGFEEEGGREVLAETPPRGASSPPQASRDGDDASPRATHEPPAFDCEPAAGERVLPQGGASEDSSPRASSPSVSPSTGGAGGDLQASSPQRLHSGAKGHESEPVSLAKSTRRKSCSQNSDSGRRQRRASGGRLGECRGDAHSVTTPLSACHEEEVTVVSESPGAEGQEPAGEAWALTREKTRRREEGRMRDGAARDRERAPTFRGQTFSPSSTSSLMWSSSSESGESGGESEDAAATARARPAQGPGESQSLVGAHDSSEGVSAAAGAGAARRRAESRLLTQHWDEGGYCQRHVEALGRYINMREIVEHGTMIFNSSPMAGIRFLQQQNILDDNSLSVAAFLLATDGLDKRMIGELVGGPDAASISFLNAFCTFMSFANMPVDEALRHFLTFFFMPGEAQVIFRILDRFAAAYARDNPETPLSLESLHVLAYALLILNTSLHHPRLQSKDRKVLLSRADFLKMVTCAGVELSEQELGDTYSRILLQEFKTSFSASEKTYARLSAEKPAGEGGPPSALRRPRGGSTWDAYGSVPRCHRSVPAPSAGQLGSPCQGRFCSPNPQGGPRPVSQAPLQSLVLPEGIRRSCAFPLAHAGASASSVDPRTCPDLGTMSAAGAVSAAGAAGRVACRSQCAKCGSPLGGVQTTGGSRGGIPGGASTWTSVVVAAGSEAAATGHRSASPCQGASASRRLGDAQPLESGNAPSATPAFEAAKPEAGESLASQRGGDSCLPGGHDNGAPPEGTRTGRQLADAAEGRSGIGEACVEPSTGYLVPQGGTGAKDELQLVRGAPASSVAGAPSRRGFGADAVASAIRPATCPSVGPSSASPAREVGASGRESQVLSASVFAGPGGTAAVPQAAYLSSLVTSSFWLSAPAVEEVPQPPVAPPALSLGGWALKVAGFDGMEGRRKASGVSLRLHKRYVWIEDAELCWGRRPPTAAGGRRLSRPGTSSAPWACRAETRSPPAAGGDERPDAERPLEEFFVPSRGGDLGAREQASGPGDPLASALMSDRARSRKGHGGEGLARWRVAPGGGGEGRSRASWRAAAASSHNGDMQTPKPAGLCAVTSVAVSSQLGADATRKEGSRGQLEQIGETSGEGESNASDDDGGTELAVPAEASSAARPSGWTSRIALKGLRVPRIFVPNPFKRNVAHSSPALRPSDRASGGGVPGEPTSNLSRMDGASPKALRDAGGRDSRGRADGDRALQGAASGAGSPAVPQPAASERMGSSPGGAPSGSGETYGAGECLPPESGAPSAVAAPSSASGSSPVGSVALTQGAGSPLLAPQAASEGRPKSRAGALPAAPMPPGGGCAGFTDAATALGAALSPAAAPLDVLGGVRGFGAEASPGPSSGGTVPGRGEAGVKRDTFAAVAQMWHHTSISCLSGDVLTPVGAARGAGASETSPNDGVSTAAAAAACPTAASLGVPATGIAVAGLHAAGRSSPRMGCASSNLPTSAAGLRERDGAPRAGEGSAGSTHAETSDFTRPQDAPGVPRPGKGRASEPAKARTSSNRESSNHSEGRVRSPHSSAGLRLRRRLSSLRGPDAAAGPTRKAEARAEGSRAGAEKKPGAHLGFLARLFQPVLDMAQPVLGMAQPVLGMVPVRRYPLSELTDVYLGAPAEIAAGIEKAAVPFADLFGDGGLSQPFFLEGPAWWLSSWPPLMPGKGDPGAWMPSWSTPFMPFGRGDPAFPRASHGHPDIGPGAVCLTLSFETKLVILVLPYHAPGGLPDDAALPPAGSTASACACLSPYRLAPAESIFAVSSASAPPSADLPLCPTVVCRQPSAGSASFEAAWNPHAAQSSVPSSACSAASERQPSSAPAAEGDPHAEGLRARGGGSPPRAHLDPPTGPAPAPEQLAGPSGAAQTLGEPGGDERDLDARGGAEVAEPSSSFHARGKSQRPLSPLAAQGGSARGRKGLGSKALQAFLSAGGPPARAALEGGRGDEPTAPGGGQPDAGPGGAAPRESSEETGDGCGGREPSWPAAGGAVDPLAQQPCDASSVPLSARAAETGAPSERPAKTDLASADASREPSRAAPPGCSSGYGGESAQSLLQELPRQHHGPPETRPQPAEVPVPQSPRRQDEQHAMAACEDVPTAKQNEGGAVREDPERRRQALASRGCAEGLALEGGEGGGSVIGGSAGWNASSVLDWRLLFSFLRDQLEFNRVVQALKAQREAHVVRELRKRMEDSRETEWAEQILPRLFRHWVLTPSLSFLKEEAVASRARALGESLLLVRRQQRSQALWPYAPDEAQGAGDERATLANKRLSDGVSCAEQAASFEHRGSAAASVVTPSSSVERTSESRLREEDERRANAGRAAARGQSPAGKQAPARDSQEQESRSSSGASQPARRHSGRLYGSGKLGSMRMSAEDLRWQQAWKRHAPQISGSDDDGEAAGLSPRSRANATGEASSPDFEEVARQAGAETGAHAAYHAVRTDGLEDLHVSAQLLLLWQAGLPASLRGFLWSLALPGASSLDKCAWRRNPFMRAGCPSAAWSSSGSAGECAARRGGSIAQRSLASVSTTDVSRVGSSTSSASGGRGDCSSRARQPPPGTAELAKHGRKIWRIDEAAERLDGEEAPPGLEASGFPLACSDAEEASWAEIYMELRARAEAVKQLHALLQQRRCGPVGSHLRHSSNDAFSAHTPAALVHPRGPRSERGPWGGDLSTAERPESAGADGSTQPADIPSEEAGVQPRVLLDLKLSSRAGAAARPGSAPPADSLDAAAQVPAGTSGRASEEAREGVRPSGPGSPEIQVWKPQALGAGLGGRQSMDFRIEEGADPNHDVSDDAPAGSASSGSAAQSARRAQPDVNLPVRGAQEQLEAGVGPPHAHLASSQTRSFAGADRGRSPDVASEKNTQSAVVRGSDVKENSAPATQKANPLPDQGSGAQETRAAKGRLDASAHADTRSDASCPLSGPKSVASCGETRGRCRVSAADGAARAHFSRLQRDLPGTYPLLLRLPEGVATAEPVLAAGAALELLASLEGPVAECVCTCSGSGAAPACAESHGFAPCFGAFLRAAGFGATCAGGAPGAPCGCGAPSSQRVGFPWGQPHACPPLCTACCQCRRCQIAEETAKQARAGAALESDWRESADATQLAAEGVSDGALRASSSSGRQGSLSHGSPGGARLDSGSTQTEREDGDASADFLSLASFRVMAALDESDDEGAACGFGAAENDVGRPASPWPPPRGNRRPPEVQAPHDEPRVTQAAGSEPSSPLSAAARGAQGTEGAGRCRSAPSRPTQGLPPLEPLEATAAGSSCEAISTRRSGSGKLAEKTVCFCPRCSIAAGAAEVVECVVLHMPTIGYVQGMAAVAAVLLFFVEREKAFVLMVQMLQLQPLPDFFMMSSLGKRTLRHHLSAFKRLLAALLPDLSEHFTSLHLSPSFYLLPWVLSLFTSALPLHIVVRVWDCFILAGGGRDTLFQIALAILHYYDDALKRCSFEGCVALLSRQNWRASAGTAFDEDRFFAGLRWVEKQWLEIEGA